MRRSRHELGKWPVYRRRCGMGGWPASATCECRWWRYVRRLFRSGIRAVWSAIRGKMGSSETADSGFGRRSEDQPQIPPDDLAGAGRFANMTRLELPLRFTQEKTG